MNDDDYDDFDELEQDGNYFSSAWLLEGLTSSKYGYLKLVNGQLSFTIDEQIDLGGLRPRELHGPRARRPARHRRQGQAAEPRADRPANGSRGARRQPHRRHKSPMHRP